MRGNASNATRDRLQNSASSANALEGLVVSRDFARANSRHSASLARTAEEECKRDHGADRKTMVVPVAVLFTRLLSFVRAR
jgi:hypothetical protein